MKYLILFLISISIHAADLYVKVEDGKVTYSTYDKSLCQGCVKIDQDKGYDPEIYDQADELVDDITKPLYEAKSKVVACSDLEDCIQKEKDQKCSDKKFVVRTDTEVYCTKLAGYEQVLSGDKVGVVNPQKKAAKDAAKEAKKSAYESLKQDLKDGKTLTNKQVSDLLRVLIDL